MTLLQMRKLCWWSWPPVFCQVFKNQGLSRVLGRFQRVANGAKLSELSILPVARQRQKQRFCNCRTMIWLVGPRVPVYIVSRAARNGGKDSTNTNKGEI